MRTLASLCAALVLAVPLAASPPEAGDSDDSTTSASYVLKRGRTVDVRFCESIRPRGTSDGQRVELEVADDVLVDGRALLREGAKVIGHVEEVKRRAAAGAPARLDVVVDFAETASGDVVPLSGLYSAAGADRTVEAAGIAVFWCLCGLLIPGEDTLISQGTVVTCFVREDTTIHVEEPDAEIHTGRAGSSAADSTGNDAGDMRGE